MTQGLFQTIPCWKNCVGAEENYQDKEAELQDTVGHGTAVAGCAVYGGIEDNLTKKEFTPSNWLFSAKVMYAEKNQINGTVHAVYDEEKLIEHQFQEAIEDFLNNPEYHIKVVNISLGNSNEIWGKHYFRQLPLASLIDELALKFSGVVFVVSAGNKSPEELYESITEITENYPFFLVESEDFRIINPATSALALSVGSISPMVRTENYPFGQEETIKTPIAKKHQPSPFTRTGPSINGMIKPELVEYGGNLILYENSGYIREDKGGKLALLNNKVTENIIKFDAGTSFASAKVAYTAGQLANHFPEKSANFLKNMLLVGSEYPFPPTKEFYGTNGKTEQHHLYVSGYGLSDYERACHSYDNKAVLWDEGTIAMNQVKIYSLELPELFFTEIGKKKITVVLTFTPETRSTRGDSYLGNRMKFHLFHSIKPQSLKKKYGVIPEDDKKIVCQMN